MIGSVEPSKTYNIVPGARTSRSSVLCPGGELRRLIDELLPTRAVLRELGPLLEVRCNACPCSFNDFDTEVISTVYSVKIISKERRVHVGRGLLPPHGI